MKPGLYGAAAAIAVATNERRELRTFMFCLCLAAQRLRLCYRAYIGAVKFLPHRMVQSYMPAP
jgi:hypothetical protein